MKQKFDVTIVGQGPVGSMLAILLGKKGYRVGVFERWPNFYPLPRAIIYDSEIARMLRIVCDHEKLEQISENIYDKYQWKNASGEVLLTLERPEKGASGLPNFNFFNQPDLEKILDEACRNIPSVEIFRGYEAVDIFEQEDSVELIVENESGEQRSFSSTYLVGCDGANSIVRKKLDTAFTDIGSEYTWLVVDIIPHDNRKMEPSFWQLCNPERPTTILPGGPGRRRWEFMALPGENPDELNTEETTWELLKPWGYTKDNCELVRHAVYTFRGAWAETWRRGRVMIAGDAAHLTPPFLGQGLGSGFRDVWNLAWKLDLVLQNKSMEDILEYYTEERNPNVQSYIHMGVELSKMICITDPMEAAKRDEAFLSGNVDSFPDFPHLTTGILYNYSDQPDCLTGRLSVQGVVKRDGKIGLLDDLIGTGWTVLSVNKNPKSYLSSEQIQFLESIGTHFVEITNNPTNINSYYDVNGTYEEYFNSNQIEVVIARPDFYVFGAASRVEDLSQMVESLQKQVHYNSL
ncbi:bifunctional 3-(3-hydroxy-phenyl)propionate/3-hydroxycinnamic acid hydroxylase MhpA [Priestia megaterium]|uniref:bifunctional 3-(3-hydroxy-phenyl)propionate/3-hydroxycinnamic acid hydroxylase MhpA n=1 Tax=Priestia megaterium TaxID=1404 RepID=UPI003000704C